jgi:hypothetical protein
LVAPAGNLDLPSFNFQVPMLTSLAKQMATPKKQSNIQIRHTLAFISPPLSKQNSGL